MDRVAVYDMSRSAFIARLSDAPMTDVMVDIETTGTNPHTTNMIQLAAIKFNYETGDVGEVFNRCLSFAPNRYWDEGTRQWWGKQKPEILQGIMSRMEEPQGAISDYHAYICREGRPVRMWSRGVFDWSFLESYFTQFGLPMPHRFYDWRDLRSFQAGLFGKPEEPDMSWVTAQGDAHNALFDCVIQLKRLLNCRNGVFYEIETAV